MRHKIIAVASAAFLLSACTTMQIRDNAAQTGQKLYAGYDRALTGQLDARTIWRQRCEKLKELEYEIVVEYAKSQSTLEDMLAAIDLAKERHNKALPIIETVDAFTNNDGEFLAEINQVQC